MVLTRLYQPVKISTSSIFVAIPNLIANNNLEKVKHLNHQIRKISIRAFVIPQIDFSIRFPTEIVSKKIEENIPYDERVDFGRFEYANQPSIFHLNTLRKGFDQFHH